MVLVYTCHLQVLRFSHWNCHRELSQTEYIICRRRKAAEVYVEPLLPYKLQPIGNRTLMATEDSTPTPSVSCSTSSAHSFQHMLRCFLPVCRFHVSHAGTAYVICRRRKAADIFVEYYLPFRLQNPPAVHLSSMSTYHSVLSQAPTFFMSKHAFQTHAVLLLARFAGSALLTLGNAYVICRCRKAAAVSVESLLPF
jgi:hypothetical protein